MIRIIKTVVFILAMMLVGLAGLKAVNYKLETLRHARENVSPITAEVRQKQLDCLARNIYHEAGSEPFEGKVAVAQVTINRTESGQFPSDICQVVYQKNIVYEKVFCQFSWYCCRRQPFQKSSFPWRSQVPFIGLVSMVSPSFFIKSSGESERRENLSSLMKAG